jgi:16S rRNA processing protein RimM
MVHTPQYKRIGDVLKTFGANGGLIVKIQEDVPRTILQNKEPVFIYIDGLPVPFYIKAAEYKGTSKLVVVFEDMETEALATELIGKSIYLASKEAAAEPGGSELDILVGYTAIDKNYGELGVVKEVMDIPGNPCLVLSGQATEVIVPLNQELITGIDRQKKQIHLNVPNGLVELYS